MPTMKPIRPWTVWVDHESLSQTRSFDREEDGLIFAVQLRREGREQVYLNSRGLGTSPGAALYAQALRS